MGVEEAVAVQVAMQTLRLNIDSLQSECYGRRLNSHPAMDHYGTIELRCTATGFAYNFDAASAIATS
jgi:hypothetical protein